VSTEKRLQIARSQLQSRHSFQSLPRPQDFQF
jgi:hypothetical protein